MTRMVLCAIAISLMASLSIADDIETTHSGDGSLDHPFMLRIQNNTERTAWEVIRRQDFDSASNIQPTFEDHSSSALKYERQVDILINRIDPLTGFPKSYFTNWRGYVYQSTTDKHFEINAAGGRSRTGSRLTYRSTQIRSLPIYFQGVWQGDGEDELTTRLTSEATNSFSGDAGTFHDTSVTTRSNQQAALEEFECTYSFTMPNNTWEIDLSRGGTAVNGYDYATCNSFPHSGNPNGSESINIIAPDLSTTGRPPMLTDWLYYVSYASECTEHIDYHSSKYDAEISISPFEPEELLPPQMEA